MANRLFQTSGEPEWGGREKRALLKGTYIVTCVSPHSVLSARSRKQPVRATINGWR